MRDPALSPAQLLAHFVHLSSLLKTMFALSRVATLAIIAVPAIAASTLGLRADAPASCNGLPDGSSGTLPYNLTLAAYTLDQSGSDPTAIPLYLTWGVLSTSPAASLWAVAVRDKYS